ncbi:hypothetical protein F0P96_06175 [Hymenobacter busanensis]|uniref:Uncharacterized protein n=1 Tax=Hymenobacter busanensis TaxID=2607656 RepID=A0A7L5A048_9BACT|nr:hypothetical protein [Hymenobacter busanensis]KAA9338419.1 hypothetical protein F0P96_06175 [Hymenobacter busanensis]QHJ09154.1 hypothetical protein GUY19_18430 [Hymenobacter busanensis]
MKNELIESRLRRDTAAAAFLAQTPAAYADIEDDVAPLRTQLAANVQRGADLAQQVLTADTDGNPARKKGTRNQLTVLLRRLILAIRAEALRSTDAKLRAAAGRLGELRNLNESSFGEEAQRLLDLVPGRETALAKRRFTAAHYQEARTLLAAFGSATTEGRLSDVSGSTGRQALERLIKDSARLLKELETYFALYQEDDPDLWNRFRQAIKVVRRGGSEGSTNNLDLPPSRK